MDRQQMYPHPRGAQSNLFCRSVRRCTTAPRNTVFGPLHCSLLGTYGIPHQFLWRRHEQERDRVPTPRHPLPQVLRAILAQIVGAISPPIHIAVLCNTFVLTDLTALRGVPIPYPDIGDWARCGNTTWIRTLES
ncbi:hypothetical protein BDM02DRAFT_1546783 [Thelephora ganbajun]|uniref:Uncharacterized protein n=1 Tax=Thelephora ganbajun TaxID=370292 RepID=A0ACB6Z1V4_THEGA|nr:hypothetical protein BDM02DRAFT_1546783 [Thelephora ganbajun]